MYLWLKRLFYGCNHDRVFITKFSTYEYPDAPHPWKTTSIHRCSKCMKIKKGVFK